MNAVGVLKEILEVYFSCYSGICLKSLRKTTNNLKYIY
jgi:hypothetical protein